MLKKLLVALFTISLGMLISFNTLAQNAVEEDVTEEETTPDVITPANEDANNAGGEEAPVSPVAGEERAEEASAVEVPATTAAKAKTYFDGVNTYVNSRVLYKLKTSDNFQADKIMYKIDSNEEKTYEREFNISEEGKHSISYYGIDKIGNKEDAKFFHVIVDNSTPELVVNTNVPLLKKNDKYYISKSVSFSVDAKDNLSGVNKINYTLNGQDFIEYSTSFNIYQNGDISLKFNAMDNVENQISKFKIKLQDENGAITDAELDTLSVFVDNTAPEVSITPSQELTKLNGKNIASREYSYTIAATDNEVGVKSIMVRVDGKGDFIPYSNAIKFNTNGDHFIEAKATDAVGNISKTIVLPIYVDIIPPKSNIETVSE